MIHHHSSPNMLPYHRHEKGEGPLAAPANISGPSSGGSAFHDAVHPYKGDDHHRIMEYERQRSHHSRHPPPNDDQPRRVPVKTEDHAESNISSWNSSDKARDYVHRQYPRGRDSSSPSRGFPPEQGKPINIKAYNPTTNDRMVSYPGPQTQHHWIGEQNPHEFDGYGQPKGSYDSKTSPMQMPQASGFGPQSNGARAEGHSAFNRSHYSKYHSMKQDPKLKRNAMHAYITYMIYTDQTQKRAQQQTITPSSSRESYSGPIGGPPSHPAPPRSRSSSVPMPPQSGPNSASGAPYSSYSGAREPREQYQYAAQPLGPSHSMGYNGHPVYDEKRPLSAPTQRSPTSSSARPSQPVQSPYANQYAPAPAHHHSRNRTPQQSPRLLPERSPTIAPHLRRPSESDPIPRGPPGAAQAPPSATLPPLSGPPHHHHHQSPTHHHHHHYPDGPPPNPQAHAHSAPPPPHHAPYSWTHSGSQAPYSPPTASQTLAPPPPHHSYSSPSPGSNSAPNGRVPPSSMPPAPYSAQHITPSNSLPPPPSNASFTGAGPALPQPPELPDRGNPALTQYLRPGQSAGPRREEPDRPSTSAGHPEVQLPPITSTVAPGAPASSGPTRNTYFSPR